MIVNYKKENAGILNVPCIKGGDIVKYITLLPGHNEVDEADWKLAKSTADRLIKKGYLEELVEEKTIMINGKNKVKTTFKGDVDFEKNFPFNDVLSVMRSLGIYKDVLALRLDTTGKKNFTKKWLIEYFRDNEDGQKQWDDIQEQFKESENDKDKALLPVTLDELDPETARAVIADTFNLKTLDHWLETIAQADLRVLIMNQQKMVNEPPKK